MSAGPVLCAVLLWWFGTGLVLFAVSRPVGAERAGLIGAGIAAAAGIVGLVWSAGEATALGAYVAFASALAVWGWHETGFLLGRVTGPNRAPCPPGATGWRRFRLATATVIHHEIAIALTALGLFAATWHQPNRVGAWTFGALAALRLCAKLNVYLGVPNLSLDLMPERLRYLSTYFRKAPMNPILPATLALTTALAWAVLHAAAGAEGGFDRTALALVGTLLALGALEHWFLVLPLPDTALWRWVPRVRPEGRPCP